MARHMPCSASTATRYAHEHQGMSNLCFIPKIRSIHPLVPQRNLVTKVEFEIIEACVVKPHTFQNCCHKFNFGFNGLQPGPNFCDGTSWEEGGYSGFRFITELPRSDVRVCLSVLIARPPALLARSLLPLKHPDTVRRDCVHCN